MPRRKPRLWAWWHQRPKGLQVLKLIIPILERFEEFVVGSIFFQARQSYQSLNECLGFAPNVGAAPGHHRVGNSEHFPDTQPATPVVKIEAKRGGPCASISRRCFEFLFRGTLRCIIRFRDHRFKLRQIAMMQKQNAGRVRQLPRDAVKPEFVTTAATVAL